MPPLFQKTKQILHKHPWLGLLGFASIWRLPFLGSALMGHDESNTFFMVNQILKSGDFSEVFSLSIDAPLYTYVMVYWTQWFGTDLFWFRLPSALFGILSVALVYGCLSFLLPKHNAIAVSGLCAISPFLIFHARNARPYSLVLLLFLLWLGLYFRHQTAQNQTRKSLLLMGVLGTLILSTQYSSVYPLLAFFIIMGVHYTRHRHWRPFFDLLAVGGLMTLGMLPVALAAYDRWISHMAWLVPWFDEYLQVLNIDLWYILGNQILFINLIPNEAFTSLQWGYLGYCVLWFWPMWKAWKTQALPTTPLLTHFWWLAPVLSWPMWYFPRVYIVTTPFLLGFWWTCTHGWLKTRIFHVMLMIGMSVFVLMQQHVEYGYRHHILDITQQIKELEEPGDVILLDPRISTHYYQYFYDGVNKVHGVGMDLHSEKKATFYTHALEHLETLSPGQRVLLISTSFKNHDSAKTQVESYLDQRYIRVRQIPCVSKVWSGVICDRITLYEPRAHLDLD